MSQPRKRSNRRPTEYEDLARKEGWDEGFDAGYQQGRDDAMYDRGHMDGWHAGIDQGACRAYDAGFQDATAGKPPQHQPHDFPEGAKIRHKDGDPTNNSIDNLELDESRD